MNISHLSQRQFLRTAAALVVVLAIERTSALGEEKTDLAAWIESLEDPVRKRFPGKPDLDTILGLFPRTASQPAFDPEEIAAKAAKL